MRRGLRRRHTDQRRECAVDKTPMSLLARLRPPRLVTRGAQNTRSRIVSDSGERSTGGLLGSEPDRAPPFLLLSRKGPAGPLPQQRRWGALAVVPSPCQGWRSHRAIARLDLDRGSAPPPSADQRRCCVIRDDSGLNVSRESGTRARARYVLFDGAAEHAPGCWPVNNFSDQHS
jgi:hypothetical protein